MSLNRRRRISSLQRIQSSHPILKYQNNVSMIPRIDLIQFIKEILSLPPNKRTPFDLSVLQSIVQEVEFFKEHPKAVSKGFLKYSSYLFFPKEQMVFGVGTVGREFYVIIEGVVGIYVPARVTFASLSETERSALAAKMTPDQAKKVYAFNASQTSSSNLNAQEKASGKSNQFLKQISLIYQPSLRLEEEGEIVYFVYKVNSLSIGSCFGELSLFGGDEKRRTATVLAETDCHFAIIDKKRYNVILGDFQKQKTKKMINFLSQTSFFSQWERKTLKTMQYHFTNKRFHYGQKVFKQGDQCNSVFIVKQGKLRLFKEVSYLDLSSDQYAPNPLRFFNKKRKIPFAMLSEFDIVGEDDAIEGNCRSYSCIAEENCDVYEISKKEFMKRLVFDEGRKSSALEMVKSKKERWEENFLKNSGIFKLHLESMVATPLVFKGLVPAFKYDFGTDIGELKSEEKKLRRNDDQKRYSSNEKSKVANKEKHIKKPSEKYSVQVESKKEEQELVIEMDQLISLDIQDNKEIQGKKSPKNKKKSQEIAQEFLEKEWESLKKTKEILQKRIENPNEAEKWMSLLKTRLIKVRKELNEQEKELETGDKWIKKDSCFLNKRAIALRLYEPRKNQEENKCQLNESEEKKQKENSKQISKSKGTKNTNPTFAFEAQRDSEKKDELKAKTETILQIPQANIQKLTIESIANIRGDADLSPNKEELGNSHLQALTDRRSNDKLNLDLKNSSLNLSARAINVNAAVTFRESQMSPSLTSKLRSKTPSIEKSGFEKTQGSASTKTKSVRLPMMLEMSLLGHPESVGLSLRKSLQNLKSSIKVQDLIVQKSPAFPLSSNTFTRGKHQKQNINQYFRERKPLNHKEEGMGGSAKQIACEDNERNKGSLVDLRAYYKDPFEKFDIKERAVMTGEGKRNANRLSTTNFSFSKSQPHFKKNAIEARNNSQLKNNSESPTEKRFIRTGSFNIYSCRNEQNNDEEGIDRFVFKAKKSWTPGRRFRSQNTSMQMKKGHSIPPKEKRRIQYSHSPGKKMNESDLEGNKKKIVNEKRKEEEIGRIFHVGMKGSMRKMTSFFFRNSISAKSYSVVVNRGNYLEIIKKINKKI